MYDNQVFLSPAGMRSLENPSTTLADPDAWLVEFFGGGNSSSGIRINRHTALTYAAVWRAVSLIARDIARIPIHVHRRIPSGGKERARDHPAFRLLRRKANREMTAFVFKETLTAHMLLHGNGYGYIMRRGDGRPEEIVPLNPEQTEPVREMGMLFYVTHIDGQTLAIDPSDILHLKGLGFDGLQGYSVLSMAANSLGLGLAAREYGARFFGNDARPGAVLETPKRLQQKARENLRESWNRLHKGVDNAHKVAILEEGLQLKPYSMSAKDSQFIETRQFEIRDVANWFGVPPHKLGDSSRTAYNSLEQENQAYIQEALDGRLCTWEDECWDKLLAEKEKDDDSHFVEFERKALVRADLSARTDYYATSLQNGWMNRDEVRELENMNPIPDGSGSQYLVNLTMGTVDSSDNGDRSGHDPRMRELRHRAEEVLGHTLVRMVRRIGNQAERKKDPKQLLSWIKTEMYRDNSSVVTEALSAPVDQMLILSGCDTSRRGAVIEIFFEYLYDHLLKRASSQTITEAFEGFEKTVAESIIEFIEDQKND